MAAGSGLLKAKGLGSSATPGSVISAPELSNNLERDKTALESFNNMLKAGYSPAEAYADNLTNVSRAAQDFARQSGSLPADIDKFANAQTAASMATKLSTGSMIAQSVASAALTGAISMGVTLAVNGLVMGLDYLAHAHERAVEAVDHANAAYAENQKELIGTSQSLAEVEERLNALNRIEHKSLAEESETEELQKQQRYLEAQVSLLKHKSELLQKEKKEAADQLNRSVETGYSISSGKQSWLERGITAIGNGIATQASSYAITPSISETSQQIAHNQNMSSTDYETYWTGQFINNDSLDRTSEAAQNARDALIALAEEYQKTADSSTDSLEHLERINYALDDSSERSQKLGKVLQESVSSDLIHNLYDTAAAGKLTAENLEGIVGADVAGHLNGITGSAETTADQLTYMARTGYEAQAATENLQSATASLAEVNQKIAAVESAVNSQRSLSGDEVDNLCAKYPELKKYVVETADGFRIEENALSILQGVMEDVSIGYIQAQISMSEAALNQANNRIAAMSAESKAMAALNNLSYDSVSKAFPDSNILTSQEYHGLPASLKQYDSHEEYLASFFGKEALAAVKHRSDLAAELNNAKSKLIVAQQNIKKDYVNKSSQTRSGSRGGGSVSRSQSYQNTALDNELKRIEHLKALGKYEDNELGYIRALENAKSKLAKKEDERWQLEEKIYAAREAYNKKQLDDYLDEISYKEAMGKYDDNQAQKIADLTYAYNKLAKKKEDLRKLEQQIYRETKAYQEAEAKKAKDAADAIEDIVDMRMKYIRKEQELKKKALEDELDGYQKLYDAQSKALDKQKEADDYAKTAAKKRKAIAEIETRLNELSADTSAASQREQAELRAELAEKQEELEEYENEQSIQKQKEKLDEEYQLLEEQNNAKIEKIDEFLDNEGAVRDAAMADIMTRSNTVYTELLEWNKKYGDGINKTVTDAWKAATEALQQYGSQANALKIAENPDDIRVPAKTPGASAQQKPASGGSSSANKAPVKGGRVSVTVKDAAAYASSTGKRVGSWSTMAKNAGVGWNQKLYVTNIANGKVAIGTTSKIGNTIAWVDKKNVKGYRTGSPFIPYDQLALVDEAGPELIIRNPVQGRLTHLSRGDGVLNSTLTERIMALAGNPAAFLSQRMAKLTSAFGTGMSTGAAPSIQIDSKVIVEGNADRETVKALEKAENRIAEKVFSQANKKYLRSGHTINPKHLG